MNILFLCVANSARSQMAEGLARALAKPGVRILSAGSRPAQVNPFAILALKELNIDISAHTSKSVNDVDPQGVDVVITLCAEEVCPVFLGKARKLHWPFKDPAGIGSTDSEKLSAFQAIRDQIQAKLVEWLSAEDLLR